MCRNKIIVILVFIFSSLALHAEDFRSRVDMLKGEKWWGVFVASGEMMPFDEPFKVNNTAVWDNGVTTPFLVSSSGRYIWSAAPFAIEFTGNSFLINSPIEKVVAVSAGKTLREAYLVCCHRNFPPNGAMPAQELFTNPVYRTKFELGIKASADEILDYANKLLQADYPVGTIVIPALWQSTPGSMTVNQTLFPDMKSLVNSLHAKGFKVSLTITPFVSGDSDIFREHREKDYFVADGAKIMVEWDGGVSAFYDVTNQQVYDFIKAGIDGLRSQYAVDGFLFDCYEVLPFLYLSSGGEKKYMERWSELGAGEPMSQYTVSRGSGFAPYITYIKSTDEQNWNTIKQLTRQNITANLLCFPYSSVVADVMPHSPIAENPQLYMRYFQMQCMMPTVSVDIAPWRIQDPEIVSYCRSVINYRHQLSDYIADMLKEVAKTAEPLIRHMEYSFPRNGFSDCDDQFMLGSKYLVAPIYTPDNKRIVRLPRGNWIGPGMRKYKGPLVTTVTAVDSEMLVFELMK